MGTFTSFRKAYGALKDTTTVGLAKVNSEFKDLDIAIVKATNHVESPPKERHVRKIFSSSGHDRTRSRQWIPPPPGWYKCNFDSGFVQGRAFTNTGWIIRDDSGKAILSGYAKLQEAHSTLQSEAMGFLHVLQVCWAQGLRFIWFEGDNSELINLINTGGDHNEIGTLLYGIRFWMNKLPYSSLAYTNRERNEAADVLAKHASLVDSLYQTFSVPPRWLLNYLYPPFTV